MRGWVDVSYALARAGDLPPISIISGQPATTTTRRWVVSPKHRFLFGTVLAIAAGLTAGVGAFIAYPLALAVAGAPIDLPVTDAERRLDRLRGAASIVVGLAAAAACYLILHRAHSDAFPLFGSHRAPGATRYLAEAGITAMAGVVLVLVPRRWIRARYERGLRSHGEIKLFASPGFRVALLDHAAPTGSASGWSNPTLQGPMAIAPSRAVSPSVAVGALPGVGHGRAADSQPGPLRTPAYGGSLFRVLVFSAAIVAVIGAVVFVRNNTAKTDAFGQVVAPTATAPSAKDLPSQQAHDPVALQFRIAVTSLPEPGCPDSTTPMDPTRPVVRLVRDNTGDVLGCYRMAPAFDTVLRATVAIKALMQYSGYEAPQPKPAERGRCDVMITLSSADAVKLIADRDRG